MFLAAVAWLALAVFLPLLWLKSKVTLPRSFFYGTAANDKETPCRRSVKAPANALVNSPSNGVKTAYEMLKYAVKLHSSKPLFGQRDINRIVEEERQVVKKVAGVEKTETKTWKFFELSSYSWMSFSEVSEATLQIGKKQQQAGGEGGGTRGDNHGNIANLCYSF
jgi:long-chain acyl-CoA synthetase